MILVIDNRDSFVYNIVRYFRELGRAVEVVRSDAITCADIRTYRPEAIVISPGPCTPLQAGISMAAIRAFSGVLPVLGICLGHQCIGAVFGGKVVRATRPMHGRASMVSHDKTGLFTALPNPLRVGRYHSLVVENGPDLSGALRVDARSAEGEIMALSHRTHPTFGVQFHPESILTDAGYALFENFLRVVPRRAPARAWPESGP